MHKKADCISAALWTCIAVGLLAVSTASAQVTPSPTLKPSAVPKAILVPPIVAPGTLGSCPSAVRGNSCSSVVNLGFLNPGNSVTASGGPLLAAATSEYWYSVTMRAPYLQGAAVMNAAANPRMTVTGTTKNYVFDVYADCQQQPVIHQCAGPNLVLPATALTAFSGAYVSTGNPPYMCTLPNSAQTLIVRVRATDSNPNCGTYTLQLGD
jgi:hypothetical protein